MPDTHTRTHTQTPKVWKFPKKKKNSNFVQFPKKNMTEGLD